MSSASSAPERRRATYEDLLRLPEHVVGELIDGDLVASPRPAGHQAAASSNLRAGLIGAFGRKGPGGWVILDEPEVHLAGQVMVPDIAGWRYERMPEVPDPLDAPDVPHFDLPPDWVCDVLSPATAGMDRTRKRQLYAEAGVRHLWLLDPDHQTLEVFRLDGGGWLLAHAAALDDRLRPEPFEAMELDLAATWAR